jgi:hypothetical protein
MGRVATSAFSPSTRNCSWAAGDLGGRGGLARALKADHHHDGGRSDVHVELGGFGAEHLDEGVVDDLDDLLAGRDRSEHLLADRLLGRLVDELADHRQSDVGLEQSDPDFAHRGADVGLGQRAAAAKPIEDGAKAVAQTVEHALLPFTESRPKSLPRAGGGKREKRRRAKLAGQRAPPEALFYPKGMWGRIAARGRIGKVARLRPGRRFTT